MLFSELPAQKRKSRSLEFVHRLSSTDEVYSKSQERSHEIVKKTLHISLLDLVASRRSSDGHEKKTTEQQKHGDGEKQQQQQQQQSYPRRRSIIRSADLPRSLSKKSVTFASFASVFNLSENESERDQVSYHHDINLNHKTFIGKDFVIIIRSRQIDDDVTTDSGESAESFARVPNDSLSPSSQMKTVPATFRPSRKSLIHELIHHHQERKRRQSIKTITSPSTTPPPSMRAHDQEQSVRNLGTWLKSSSFGRLVKSLGKHSHPNPKAKDTKTKTKKRHRSSKLRRLSDYIL